MPGTHAGTSADAGPACGLQKGFTQRYGLVRFVWYEHRPDIRDAIQRERTMEHGSRAWKVRLILDMNPEWRDLYEDLNA